MVSDLIEPETAVQENSERYSLKLRDILERAASLFAREGYHNTSIRDLSRDMDISLAGLYYYFKTKEELLFLISKHSFDSVLSSLDERLKDVRGPEQKLGALVQNHLQYFVTHLDAMKVLAHESDGLRGAYFDLIQKKKRSYLDRMESLLLEIERKSNPSARRNDAVKVAALSLFGMMNWTYTWYNPSKREHSLANVRRIADRMTELFLHGFVRTKK